MQGFRLLSLSAYVPDSSPRAATKLIRSLPSTRLTALHLTGPWALSARAAAALTAATALRALTLPGDGLGEALAAHPATLLTGLERLRLSDAGACSAATLEALSEQLGALTHLALDYGPLEEGEEDSAGVVVSQANSSNSVIVRDVQHTWAELPALRSLAIGARKVAPDPGWDWAPDPWLGGGELPERQYLSVTDSLLDSIAALTGLTGLTLGPSARLEQLDGLEWLVGALESTGLQQLVLTLQVRRLRALRCVTWAYLNAQNELAG